MFIKSVDVKHSEQLMLTVFSKSSMNQSLLSLQFLIPDHSAIKYDYQKYWALTFPRTVYIDHCLK